MIQRNEIQLNLLSEEDILAQHGFHSITDWKYASKTKSELLYLLAEKIMKEDYADCRLIRYQLLKR